MMSPNSAKRISARVLALRFSSYSSPTALGIEADVWDENARREIHIWRDTEAL
jgi:hypothetical protein